MRYVISVYTNDKESEQHARILMARIWEELKDESVVMNLRQDDGKPVTSLGEDG